MFKIVVKIIALVLFLNTALLSYTKYENNQYPSQKGKIDMHGGKGIQYNKAISSYDKNSSNFMDIFKKDGNMTTFIKED